MTEEQLKRAAEIFECIQSLECIYRQINTCHYLQLIGYTTINHGGSGIGMSQLEEAELFRAALPVPHDELRRIVAEELARLKEEAEKL